VLGEFSRFYGGVEERGERERLVWEKGRRRQATGYCSNHFWWPLNQQLDFLKFKSDL